jgi:hypothetical protein
MIDMASVYANRYKQNPQMLQAAVLGQSPDPKLDPYTALNALRLVKESNMMAMSRQAQQPTSAPSIVAQNMAPNPMQQGLGAMVPGAMGQGAPAPQGMLPQAPAAPVMQKSGGLAGMPTPEYEYAQGGIVAFKDEGLVRGETEEDYQGETRDTGYSDSQGRSTDAEGNLLDDEDDGEGGQLAQAAKNVKQSRAELMGMKDEGLSQAEFNRVRQDSLDFAKKNAGPDIYEPANRRLREREEARGRNVSQGQGLAMLAAAGAILEGNSLARGAAKAFPVFAQQMGEVQRADIAEQRSIEGMQFSLADAQRKERMGDIRGAQAAAETARKEKADANRFKLNKAQALAKLDADVYRAASRPNKGAGGAGPKLAEQLAAAELAFAKNPTKENKADVDALTRAAAKTRTSFSTGEIGALKAETALEPVRSRENIEANKALDKHKLMNGREWKKDVETAGSVEAAEKKFKSKWITNNSQSAEAAPAKSSAAPAAAPKPTTATKVVSMADVNATVSASGKTKQEVMDALKAKGYTVK